MERYELFAVLFAMIIFADFVAVCIVSTVILYRKVKRLPKMHYDEKDGCWVLDDCVRIADYIHFNCGDYGIYLNYKNKKKGE